MHCARIIWIGFSCALLFLLPSVSAQKASPVFEAFTDTRELFEESYLELTFVLRNGEGTDFRPPEFKDFRVLSGPSRGISTTILNGEVSTEMRFSYTLQPRRTGMLRIGSGSIQVGRRVLRSRSIDIAVRKGGNAQQPGEKGKEDFFVRAELSKTKAYVGEQVRLDYTLYTRVDIQSYNILEESDYLDFYVEDLQNTSDRIERKIVNGREYYVRRLRSLAIYPQKTGNFTIGPAALELGILVGDGGMESLFFGGEIQRAPATTQTLSVQVLPLPGDAPASYSGAVGDYRASFLFNRREGSTDETLTLQINVSGDGDLKRLDAPALSLGDSFEVYPPKLVEEGYTEEAGKRIGRRLYEYLIVPKFAGAFIIPVEFSFFDPVSGRYQVVSERFPVQLRQGKKRQLATSDASPGADLLPLKEWGRTKKRSMPLATRPWFWLLLILPFVGIAAIFVWRRYRATPGRGKRQGNTREAAREQLRRAEPYIRSGDSRAFFEAISHTLIGYYAQQLSLSPSDQTKETILRRLSEKGISEPYLTELRQLLQRCELALFAGQYAASDMEQTYRSALRMVDEAPLP